MAARDVASVFIIDEPELSLNIKWQRELIRALLECIEGSRGQFVMASHSTELFARHRDAVVRLVDLEHQRRALQSEIDRAEEALES
jgi:predicted ATPase